MTATQKTGLVGIRENGGVAIDARGRGSSGGWGDGGRWGRGLGVTDGGREGGRRVVREGEGGRRGEGRGVGGRRVEWEVKEDRGG